ncbi:MAG TPA: hypothetical protein DCM87_13610 [Planctomycetes bacterium]|jgi:Kef-type K+ transport system membrane component KefB|nr:hypothetical protein [Planctomycetota bacterium]
MHENIWFVAAFWMGLAFVSSLVSIRIGISVALVEILVGVIAGILTVCSPNDPVENLAVVAAAPAAGLKDAGDF